MKKVVYIFLLLAIPTSLNAYTFTKTMRIGDVNEDVFQLQKFLNTRKETQISETGAGSPSNETNYFGEKTKQGVIKLQNLFASKILFPNGLSFGTGFVGPSTINFLNSDKDIINDNSTTNKLPIIESITPDKIIGEERITIIGKNFSEENNKIIFGFEAGENYTNIKSTENGTKIEVIFESNIQKIFDEKYSKLKKSGRAKVVSQFPTVDISVSIVTEEGLSNPKFIKFNLE